ncbi:MAG: cyclic peptide export ABC transporter [Pseudomonadota bacterium]
MKLLDLLSSGDHRLLTRLTVCAALSGGGSAVLLGIVNTAAAEIVDNGVDQVDWLLAGAFAVTAIVYFLSEIYLIGRIGAQVETGIDRVRGNLLDLIARADFARLEQFGQARLYESITQNSQTISQNSPVLAIAFRSALLVIAVMLYIFWLSTLAFVLVITVIALGTFIYLKSGKQLGAIYYSVCGIENRMFERVADLFYGIKEVRMSSRRSAALGAAFGDISEQKEKSGTALHGLIFQQSIIGMVAFYVLLAVVVFVVPAYSPDFSGSVMKVSTAVLFMIGPISMVVQSWSTLGAAENAAARMIDLATDLEKMVEPVADGAPITIPDDFKTIAFHDVEFAYGRNDPAHGFHLGPIDITLKRDELVFITGGNGSGKSTLIKLLTALYRPDSGHITLDDLRIGPQSIPAWRGLIATVFSDFHLFARLYGMSDINPDDAAFWLHRLEIDHVTAIRDGRFVTTDLSQGQRKRLALLVAILENRPILVLDEWAADQDPYFRRKFYREILPDLKSRGMMVIAVTHDDHYFDVADRRFHLEGGRLDEITANTAPGGSQNAAD